MSHAHHCANRFLVPLVALVLVIGTLGCRGPSDGPERGGDPTDRDGDGIVDEEDVVVTRLGVSSGEDESTLDAQVPCWAPFTLGLLAVYNGTDEARDWTARTESPVEWLTFASEGSAGAGEAVTISANYVPDVLPPGSRAMTTISVTVEGEPTESIHVSVTVGPPLRKGCQYVVVLKRITVIGRQALAIDGLALEPIVEVNAVGLGRTTSPPAGNHVLRVGQSVRPNVIFARGATAKGNLVNVQVIADVDEIDFPPLNPNDLRNQGQSGVANFNFTCIGLNSQTRVIPVPVIGNVPGEGNGVVEVEVEIVWDP